jgi:hypothetical protein
VELVHVALEVAELSELLAALVELARVGLDLLVDDLVGADVAPLGECLVADFARVGSLACVSTFMSLFRISLLSYGSKAVRTLRLPC